MKVPAWKGLTTHHYRVLRPWRTGRQFIKELNRKLVGHYNYFGLRSNEKALWSFYAHAIRCAFKWLNRRGGMRNSFNWAEFKAALEKLNVVRPGIVEKQP